MTTDPLESLVRRVTSGIHDSVSPLAGTSDRCEVVEETTAHRWRTQAARAVGAGTGIGSNDIRDLIDRAAEDLRQDRERLLDCLMHPTAWMEKLRTPGQHTETAGCDWVTWCWAVDALWKSTTAPALGWLPTDIAFVRPLAARIRFLILSEPFRHRHDDKQWLPQQDSDSPPVFDRVYGTATLHRLTSNARDSRYHWRTILDRYESIPPLLAHSPADSHPIETELDMLLFSDRAPGHPLLLSNDVADPKATASIDDLSTHVDSINRHLLPRFRLRRVARLAWTGADRAVSGGAAIVGIGAAALAVAGQSGAAAWAVLIAYAIVAGTVLRGTPTASAPWMLRWPAVAALGLLVLAGIGATWWRDIDPPTVTLGPPWAPLALLATSYGYLVIEARGHGIPRRAALGRSAGVLLAGLWHCTLVAVLGVTLILPAFADSGSDLAAWAADLDSAGRFLLLAAATTWCLTAGVFSQVLWDEAAITATLARSRWRNGGTP